MKDNIIKCRVSEKQYKEIVNACSELELSLSEFLRGAVKFSLKANAKRKERKGGGIDATESAQNWLDDFYDNYMRERGGN